MTNEPLSQSEFTKRLRAEWDGMPPENNPKPALANGQSRKPELDPEIKAYLDHLLG